MILKLCYGLRIDKIILFYWIKVDVKMSLFFEILERDVEEGMWFCSDYFLL